MDKMLILFRMQTKVIENATRLSFTAHMVYDILEAVPVKAVV